MEARAVQRAAEMVAQAATAVACAPQVAVWAVDRDGRVGFWNSACAELYGIGAEAALQQLHTQLVWPLERGDDYHAALAQVWRSAQAAPASDWQVASAGGRQLAICSVLFPVLQYGQLQQVWRVDIDISARQRNEETCRHQAQHDALTGLPNRLLLRDRLGLALAAARRQGSMLALLFLDLDHFKQINDTLGHPVGDLLLKEVAARLVRCVRGVDTVSRQGGDEFVILLADIGGIEQAAHVAGTILEALGQEFVLAPHRLTISVSIGISLYPSDGVEPDLLLSHADLAMYHAKDGGRSRFRFFNADMNARAQERVGFEQDLRVALQDRQFLLEYYPAVDLASGATLGAEALLRWRHPRLGMLLPERFMAAAEGSGLIVPLGAWVLRHACQTACGWDHAQRPMAVAVNLSPVELLQKDLAAQVAAALAAQALAPAQLELEVTEATLMRQGAGARATLAALRALGVRLTIDHFGTGYSHLGQMKDLPVDKLKIDRSFLAGMEAAGSQNGRVVRAMIGMGHSLGLRVVAEGVETDAQRAFLQQHGCDEYQGMRAFGVAAAEGLDGLLRPAPDQAGDPA